VCLLSPLPFPFALCHFWRSPAFLTPTCSGVFLLLFLRFAGNVLEKSVLLCLFYCPAFSFLMPLLPFFVVPLATRRGFPNGPFYLSRFERRVRFNFLPRRSFSPLIFFSLPLVTVNKVPYFPPLSRSVFFPFFKFLPHRFSFTSLFSFFFFLKHFRGLQIFLVSILWIF